MGWHFSPSTASIVGWLTSPEHELPGVEALDLGELDMFFRHFHHSQLEDLGFISSDPSWLEELQRESRRYSEEVDWGVSPDTLRAQLANFRRHFADFWLFGLGVGHRGDDYRRVRAFIEHAAYWTGDYAILMIPNEWSLGEMDLVAPFPAVRKIAGSIDEWPGVVFWTRSGASAFVPLEDAEGVYFELRSALGIEPSHVDAILRRHESRRLHRPSLLHLSDLHFGTDEALKRQSYLAARVEQVVEENNVGRVVITGDLFNNPTEQDALQFLNFRQALHRATRRDPIVVPGNHDEKVFGNFRWSLQQLSDLEWSNLILDEELELVFFCFDSSKDAQLARGAITQDQRLAVATAYETRATAGSACGNWLKVALLHHHPFSFPSDHRGIWRLFEKVGVEQEDFLRMEDGESFVEWCAHRGVTLLLHGHKHVPCHTSSGVTVGSQWRRVDAVGCGSSTGAGGFPLSMNLLTWSGESWAARFLVDPGDGRGFGDQLISIRHAETD